MPKSKNDKQMKRDNVNFKYSENVLYVVNGTAINLSYF